MSMTTTLRKRNLWDITKEQIYEFVEYKRELRLKKKKNLNVIIAEKVRERNGQPSTRHLNSQ